MDSLQEWKSDGFKGEQMIVLPTESFQDYVEHPQVRRLYLTDVGFFPRAEHHYRERKEGIEEYIFMYCTEGSGIIVVKERNMPSAKIRRSVSRVLKNIFITPARIIHGVFYGCI